MTEKFQFNKYLAILVIFDILGYKSRQSKHGIQICTFCFPMYFLQHPIFYYKLLAGTEIAF